MTDVPTIFGNFTIDDLVFADGSTRWATPGGSAVYAALGAALWTGASRIVAPLGVDYPVHLLDSRIDLSRCRRISHTMRNWGLYEGDNSRHFVSRSDSRCWSSFSPDVTDVATGAQTAAHIPPLPVKTAADIVSALRAAGTDVISLDLDDHDLAGGDSIEQKIALMKSADLILPSQQDTLSLFPLATPLEALRRLRERAPEAALIVIKCGAAGAIAHHAGADKWISIPAMPVTPLDTTGAGDAFCGGVLAGFSLQADPIEALLRGAVSASFCIEGLGFSALSRAERHVADDRLNWLRKRVTSASVR